ncbi:Secondary metabolism regulator [Lachnellula suecica]|uniref:Secondary metabolism regulator n=1 Tax=Lachnellula suecica TaxID=602035 RepID=A0A8T9CBR4_9HELO|nr:Secondary metabolism regulator [Lachnellula suecica]
MFSRNSEADENIRSGERTFEYKEGKYNLPNDKALVYYSAILLTSFKLIADSELGTGIWAIDFGKTWPSRLFCYFNQFSAKQYPSSQVLGIDLSAMQPLSPPPNCRFKIHDAESDWDFPEKFDYIHGRAVISCFEDPSSILRKAFDSLATNGYLEMQDIIFPAQWIGDAPIDSYLYRSIEMIVAGAAKLGRPWTNVKHYKRWMEEIGFEGVTERVFYCPLGVWAEGDHYKDLGMHWQILALAGLEAASSRFLGAAGLSGEEIKTFIEGVKRDMKDPSMHAFVAM